MNTNRFIFLSTILIFIIALSTCQFRATSTSPDSQGVILLWHSWDDAEAAVLDKIVADFMTINPQSKVIVTQIPVGQLRQRFEEATRAALGPTIVLGPSEWIKPMADSHLIVPIEQYVDPNVLTRYLPAAIQTVSYKEQLYGIPEALQTSILYYNTQRVDTPVTTLDHLFAQAEQQTIRVAIGTQFLNAFWGIQAFGGHLFDESGRVILNRGGFANWLAWLRAAQELPNMVLDRDLQVLSELFTQGEVDYLVGDTAMLSTLQTQMGKERVGVAPLPAGPIQSAGPFLTTDTFLFSRASSNRQTRLALQLAQYITNSEQATILMRRTGRVPANIQVRVNTKVDVIPNSIVTQAKSAVPLPNTPYMDTVMRLSGDAYNRTLQGVLSAGEVAQSLTETINEANGFELIPMTETQCDEIGVISLWHSWTGDELDSLQKILENFRQACPTILVQLQGTTADELFFYLNPDEEQPARVSPDIVLLPSNWLSKLPANQLFVNLSPWTDSAILQSYNPAPIQAFQSQERLLGIPLSMELNALYYNKTMADTPLRTMDDLLSQAANGYKIALPTTFHQAFWGVSAFGGTLFDDLGAVALGQGGFAEWLSWMQMADQQPNIFLSHESTSLTEQFLNGDVAYYLGSSAVLAEIEQHMEKDNIGVMVLPTGPMGEAKPFLSAQGFLLHKDINETRIPVALEFIEFATNVDSQTLLMQRHRSIPTNTLVDVQDEPAMTGFIAQAQLSLAYPTNPQMVDVERWGEYAYTLLLDEVQQETISETTTITPSAVVDGIVELINTPQQNLSDDFIMQTNTNLTSSTDIARLVEIIIQPQDEAQ